MTKMVDSKYNPNSERTLLDGFLYFVKLFYKYWWIIVGITGMVTISTVIYCIISVKLPPDRSPMPNVYKAQATLLVMQGNSQADIAGSLLVAMGLNQQGGSLSYDNSDFIREILQSRSLQDSLISEFHLAERYHITTSVKGMTRAALQSKAAFTYAQSSGTFKISYEDIDPVFAKNVVNRMVELLDEWFSLNRGMAKQKQRQLLADKISEVKSEIASLQFRLKSLQKQYGVLNVEELGQSQAASLANLRSQLILKEVEIKNYESFSKINDPRLEQLKEERQNLLDLISQNQVRLPEAQPGAGLQASGGGSREMSLPDVAQQFSQLTLELDIQQRIYNTLSPQYEAAKLTPESEPVFQILEKAEVPDMKSGPQRPRIIMMAFAGSLVASLAVVLLVNFIVTQVAAARVRGARRSNEQPF
jgi:tyrosine-protein kinase Etk/Wzc